jgi:hypothetical protein
VAEIGDPVWVVSLQEEDEIIYFETQISAGN